MWFMKSFLNIYQARSNLCQGYAVFFVFHSQDQSNVPVLNLQITIIYLNVLFVIF